MSFIKSLARRILFPNTYSSAAYVKYLNQRGISVGEHTVIFSPNHTTIDIRKPYLLSIGDYCKITKNVTILAHDYSISIARRVYGDFVGGSLPVTIGDNVFIGIGATILMGTHIGNNCVIGAGSVVKGNFPDGVVIAGNPGKIVCTLEEYDRKNKEHWVENAKRCAREIYKQTGRKPTVREMSDGYFWMYMPHTKESMDAYQDYFLLPADDYEEICSAFLQSEPLYENFEEFLLDCDLVEK